ncbi:MAG TPA: SgcJ/EcaC family oxidoreductase [Chthoniobacter sp.]|jgi:uncharacterized protein (TIGR02246 family)
MKSLFIALPLTILSTLAFAQTPASNPAGSEAGKIAQSREDAYVAAFNRADLKALGDLYTEDVQFTTDEGVAISGRAAVVDGLAKYFAKAKGAKIEIQVESARLLTPDVLAENGLSTVVSAQGNRDATRYAVTYIKKGDDWLIAQVDESAPPPIDAAAQALGGLAWMIGNWKDEAPGLTVETKVAWTKSNHFIRRSFTVTRAGSNTVEGTEIIGYDSAAGHLRSWVFDSEGGFGESTWRQEGNKWLTNVKATGPDGSQSTAQHVITKIDDNKYSWESVNRTRNGEVLPNLDRIEVSRLP